MNYCGILSYRRQHFFAFTFLIDTIPSTSTMYETLLATDLPDDNMDADRKDVDVAGNASQSNEIFVGSSDFI